MLKYGVYLTALVFALELPRLINAMNIQEGEFLVVTDQSKLPLTRNLLSNAYDLVFDTNPKGESNNVQGRKNVRTDFELVVRTNEAFSIRVSLPKYKFDTESSLPKFQLLRTSDDRLRPMKYPTHVAGCTSDTMMGSEGGCVLYPQIKTDGTEKNNDIQGVKYKINVLPGLRPSALVGASIIINRIPTVSNEAEIFLNKPGIVFTNQLLMMNTVDGLTTAAFTSNIATRPIVQLSLTDISTAQPKNFLWSVLVGGEPWPLCTPLTKDMPCSVRLQPGREDIAIRFIGNQMQLDSLKFKVSFDTITIDKEKTLVQIGAEQTLTKTQALYMTSDAQKNPVGSRGFYWTGATSSKLQVKVLEWDVDGDAQNVSWSVLIDGNIVKGSGCDGKKGKAQCEMKVLKKAMISIKVHVEKGQTVRVGTGTQVEFSAGENYSTEEKRSEQE